MERKVSYSQTLAVSFQCTSHLLRNSTNNHYLLEPGWPLKNCRSSCCIRRIPLHFYSCLQTDTLDRSAVTSLLRLYVRGKCVDLPDLCGDKRFWPVKQRKAPRILTTTSWYSCLPWPRCFGCVGYAFLIVSRNTTFSDIRPLANYKKVTDIVEYKAPQDFEPRRCRPLGFHL